MREQAESGIHRPNLIASHSSAADRDDQEGGGPTGEAALVAASKSTVTAAAGAMSGLLGMKTPYCLRAHIFQCRGLPSAEATGLLDPYIKVMKRKQDYVNKYKKKQKGRFGRRRFEGFLQI